MKIKLLNNLSVKKVRFRRGQIVTVPGGLDPESADKLIAGKFAVAVEDRAPKVTPRVVATPKE